MPWNNGRVSAPWKRAGLCGIFGPVIGCLFICTALYFASPWFSWTDNWISDMGGSDGDRPVWSAEGTESILLNAGLIISGLLGMIFADGIRRIRILDSEWGRRGTLLLFMDMAALVLVGVFPLSLMTGHYIAALSFFLLLPVSLLAMGTALTEFNESIEGSGGSLTSQDTPPPFSPLELPMGITFSDPRELGRFVKALGMIALLLVPALALPRPWGGNAIVEVLAVVMMSVFSMVFGYGLWKGTFGMVGIER